MGYEGLPAKVKKAVTKSKTAPLKLHKEFPEWELRAFPRPWDHLTASKKKKSKAKAKTTSTGGKDNVQKLAMPIKGGEAPVQESIFDEMAKKGIGMSGSAAHKLGQFSNGTDG